MNGDLLMFVFKFLFKG